MNAIAGTASVAARPFVGLRPFTFNDRDHFFGRDDQIASLFGLFDHSRFIAVIGSSGSGKSSLVRAGLLPLLEKEANTGGRAWKWSEMRPGDAPLSRLASALARMSSDAEGQVAPARRQRIASRLQSSSFGLADALDESGLPADTRLLLVVDQFEELFRFTARGVSPTQEKHNEARWGEESEQFVQLLLEPRRDRSSRIHVLITIRSDFIGDCARFSGLPEAVSATQFLVPSLPRDQLEEVIREPIDRAKANIDSRLVQQLINDCGRDLDQLPVLQHCLMRLWDRAGQSGAGETPHLKVEHYQAIGRLSRALSEHADEILSEAELKDLKLTVEQVFRALAETDREGRVTRRALPFQQLWQEAGESEDDVRRVVDRFRADDCSFLVPSPSEVPELAADTRIDVGHEALLRRWEKVSGETVDGRTGWLHAEEADGQQYRILRSMAGRGLLLREEAEFQSSEKWWTERTRTEAWAARYGGDFAAVQKLFADSKSAVDVRRAREQREADAAAERERARQEQEENQRREREQQEREEAARQERERSFIRLVYVGATAAALIVAFLFFALTQWKRASDQKADAVKQRMEAVRQRMEAETQRTAANSAMVMSLRFVEQLLAQISKQIQSGALPTGAATELLTTAEKIFASVPEAEATTALRAQLLISFVDVYYELQNFRASAEYAQRAKEAAQKLIAGNPANDDWLYLLYRAAYRLGDASVFPNTRNALREYLLAYETISKLAERHPQDARWQHETAFVLLKIGDIKKVDRDYGEALKWYRLSQEVADKVAASKIGNNVSLRHVANARMRIGDVLAEQGHWNEAFEEFQVGLKIREQLAGTFPDDNTYQSNLTVAYNRIGRFLLEGGKIDAALEQYRKALAIRSKMAQGDPNNKTSQSALAFQHTYIGDALARKPDYAGALEEYRQALTIRQSLAEQDASNVTWMRNLADLLEKIAGLFVAQEKPEAMPQYEVALKIRADLSQRFPGSAARQRELFELHLAMADFLEKQGELQPAQSHVAAALKVIEAYLARNPDNKVWREHLATVQKRIKAAPPVPE